MLKQITIATLIATTPAMAVSNNDLHAPGSFIIANGVNLYLHKTRPEMTFGQRWLWSFGACMAVGVTVEAYQGISGTGVADVKDLGRDAVGCALQWKWEWKF